MSTPTVTIIDYGVGNLLSVQRGFEHLGAKVLVSSDPKNILDANKVVLPGVGAFPDGMNALKKLGLISVIQDIAAERKPLLGICLGMQLLLEKSEEFENTAGLGLIPGRVVPIPKVTILDQPQKIPHTGWNSLQLSKSSINWGGTLLEDNKPGDSAYFVHSFMAEPAEQANRIAVTNYGGHKITAVIVKDQITGCQFHPEKSGEVGLKILKRFLLQ
jgi:glutamine amidotransferase